MAREWDTKTDSNPWGLVLETADQAAALRAHNADLEATYAPRMAAARQRLDLTLAAMFRKREDVVGLAAGIGECTRLVLVAGYLRFVLCVTGVSVDGVHD